MVENHFEHMQDNRRTNYSGRAAGRTLYKCCRD